MSFAAYGEAKDMQLATTQGGGIGLNITEVLLMNFTNSPYEHMMKEVPRYKKPAPQMLQKDRLVRGALIGGVSPVFSATGSTSKSGSIC